MNVRKRGEAQQQPNNRANGHLNGAPVEPTIKDAKTDHSRWRMLDDRGRQTWHYLESDEEVKNWPMSAADKWYLGMETVGFAHRYKSRSSVCEGIEKTNGGLTSTTGCTDSSKSEDAVGGL